MSIQAHLEHLQARHAELEKRIHAESQYPQKNDLLIHQLKKEKLAVREEIETIRTRSAA